MVPQSFGRSLILAVDISCGRKTDNSPHESGTIPVTLLSEGVLELLSDEAIGCFRTDNLGGGREGGSLAVAFEFVRLGG